MTEQPVEHKQVEPCVCCLHDPIRVEAIRRGAYEECWQARVNACQSCTEIIMGVIDDMRAKARLN